MQRVVGPLAFLGSERRLVDEHVGLARRLEDFTRRPRIPGEDDLAPGPRRPEHLFGSHRGPARDFDGGACLQSPEERALRNSEPTGCLDVEPSRTRVLDDRVAVRGDAVLYAERDDPVVAAVERVAGPKLDELHRVRELPKYAPQYLEQLDEPRRPVHRERNFPPAQRERLQHPGQAEIVVCVVVREKHLRKLDEADG
jgi:hypothetical protein